MNISAKLTVKSIHHASDGPNPRSASTTKVTGKYEEPINMRSAIYLRLDSEKIAPNNSIRVVNRERPIRQLNGAESNPIIIEAKSRNAKAASEPTRVAMVQHQ